MIATIVNCITVILGSFIGLGFRKKRPVAMEEVVFVAAGILALVIGIQMSLKTGHPLILALSLMIGGVIGAVLNIERGIVKFGEFLKNHFAKGEDSVGFAYAFLDSSVLFCVGAMALVGSFQAGAEGKYDIILTKSVMDGFVAILMTAAMGIGVAFSAIPVLLYQGILTILAVWIKPFVTDLMLNEVTAIGGCMVIMIGIGLLKLRTIKTANFLPSLVIAVLLVLLVPYIPIL
jgi:uncharacterized protein